MRSGLQWPGLLLVLSAFCGLVACGSGGDSSVTGSQSGQPETAQIEGSVYYRERIMLPPGAEVEVQLLDISKADALATVLASLIMTPEGGPPYAFAIAYDPAAIDQRMRYALRATISMQDKLLFTTTDYIDPFSGNPVDVLVRRAPGPPQQSGPTLEEQPWVLQTLAGEPAGVGAGDKPLDIQFQSDGMRVAGFSGCNRYSGSYARDGVSQHSSPLQFGLMAGTMMACAEGGEIEQKYLQMLTKVTAFRLTNGSLSLLAGAEVLATYQPM
jgi:putative lipoprotein